MNIQAPRKPLGPQPWEVVRTKLDQALPFANMRGTPYYRDAVWEQFSEKEYARRYAALRDKMKEHKLDCVIAAGGPSHWSFGAGVLWLTGHVEWHALASYVLVPRDGEPTMIYSMGGTHAEAVRRHVSPAIKDVRHSRNGKYAEVMVERLKELKLEHGRIGLMEIDPRHEGNPPMSTFDPNDNGPRVSSGNAGGGWIIGIIVVVLVGLSVWWWAGPGAGPHTANMGSSTPATTNGSAPSSSPATPPAAQSGTTK